MPGPGERELRLSDWLALCVVCERPMYGFAVAGLLSDEGSLGRVWQVPTPAVYAALQRLEELGLVQTVGEQSTGFRAACHAKQHPQQHGVSGQR